jgi:hypothetical protein
LGKSASSTDLPLRPLPDAEDIGAKYEDAYGMRMSRYGLLKSVAHLRYKLERPFSVYADELCDWLPDRIKQHIDLRLGIIPQLADAATRLRMASDPAAFIKLIGEQLDRNATSFEIVSFSVIKIHLEKFACKIYRDTRTSAHDRGVDLATNFGVVFRLKSCAFKAKPMRISSTLS